METDKRPLYVWLAVILAPIVGYLYFALQEVREGDDLMHAFFPAREFLWLIGIALVVSVGALLIAKMKDTERRNLYARRTVFFLLLPLIYFVWHFYSCTGKFCNIGDIVFGALLVSASVLFTLIFFLSLYLSKWKAVFVISFVSLEIFLIAVLGVSIVQRVTAPPVLISQ